MCNDHKEIIQVFTPNTYLLILYLVKFRIVFYEYEGEKIDAFEYQFVIIIIVSTIVTLLLQEKYTITHEREWRCHLGVVDGGYEVFNQVRQLMGSITSTAAS